MALNNMNSRPKRNYINWKTNKLLFKSLTCQRHFVFLFFIKYLHLNLYRNNCNIEMFFNVRIIWFQFEISVLGHIEMCYKYKLSMT